MPKRRHICALKGSVKGFTVPFRRSGIEGRSGVSAGGNGADPNPLRGGGQKLFVFAPRAGEGNAALIRTFFKREVALIVVTQRRHVCAFKGFAKRFTVPFRRGGIDGCTRFDACRGKTGSALNMDAVSGHRVGCAGGTNEDFAGAAVGFPIENGFRQNRHGNADDLAPHGDDHLGGAGIQRFYCSVFCGQDRQIAGSQEDLRLISVGKDRDSDALAFAGHHWEDFRELDGTDSIQSSVSFRDDAAGLTVCLRPCGCC